MSVFDNLSIPGHTARLLNFMGFTEHGIDFCDSLFWKEDNGKLAFYLILDSGKSSGADLEEVTEEDMDLLEKAVLSIREVDPSNDFWAPELFASWKRQRRCFGCEYPDTIEHLFWRD